MIHFIINIIFIKQLRKIFSTVNVYLYIIREPCLDFDKHPAEFHIIIVKIVMLAFGLTRGSFQF